MVCLIATTPLHAAGMRAEPPPSVATASGASPAATAAAAPPLDPPQVRAALHALRVRPKSGASVKPLWPNSGVVVLPTRIAPAAFSRAIATASVRGTLFSSTREPYVVRTPAVSTRSLAVNGMPSSSLGVSPRASLASESRAAARASSAHTVMKQLSTGCRRETLASTASTSSTGDTLRAAISGRRSAAVFRQSSSDTGTPQFLRTFQ